MQESGVGVADLQLSIDQTFKQKWMLAYVVTFLLLLWPLLINGTPFYFDDSASYLRGGRFGLSTALLMVHHWWQSLGPDSLSNGAGSDQKAIIATAIGQAGGTRSLIYSVVTYVLRAPGVSLVALALAQVGAVAFVVCALRQLIGPQLGIRSSIAIGGAVTFLTSAAWYANFAGPDVLAGVAIAGGTALTVFLGRTRLLLRLILVLLVAFCMTAHGSHLPVALSVLIAGAVANFLTSRQAFSARLCNLAWICSPVILAMAALLGSSYLAFGEWSLAPKRYPIQLARSVADGPGAWYLRDHCATEHYAICEIFGPNPPRTVNDFLWAKNGVRYRATPQQMERIRAEEMIIVRRAALEYPAEQARRSVTNMTSQLLHFGVDGLYFGFTISNGDGEVIRQSAPDRPRLRVIANLLIYCSFIASILLLIVYRRRLARAEVAAVLVVAVGLLANAAVCGILSGVTDRYQGRVAWVLPTLAFIILLRIWRQSWPPATNAKVTLA
jgi:hypothetical protein